MASGLRPSYPVPSGEEQRLECLSSYGVLDTPPEEDLSRLVRLASQVFETPIAFVSLVDRDRQFLKARTGLGVAETSREDAFCAHALLAEDMLVVPDAARDPRFADNPMVAGAPGIRFYAGAPLVAPGGHRLGAFSIADTSPRPRFTEANREALRDLAVLAMERLEARRLEAAMRAGMARLRNIADTSPDGIVCLDDRGDVAFWGGGAMRIFGYEAGEVLGGPFERLMPEETGAWCRARLEAVMAGEPPVLLGRTVGLAGRRRGGEVFPLELSLSRWDEDGRAMFGAIVRDTTERRRSEERLLRLARLDPLTELSNREAFRAELDRQVAAGRPFALYLIDLDGFKSVNDTYGHAAGDILLKAVSGRLVRVFDANAEIGRLGGDEFVVMVRDVVDPEAAGDLGRAVLAAIREPVDVGDGQASVRGSVGAVLYPRDGATGSELMGNADLALYHAKREGRDMMRFFVTSLRDAVLERKKLEREMRTALATGQLELHYQPQVDLRTGRVVGAEALLRWRHPVRGLLSAKDFTPLQESGMLSMDIGQWVLSEACRQASAWRAGGEDGFRVAVNLCGMQANSPSLMALVEGALAGSGLDPRGLELELTETTMLRDDEQMAASFRRLRELGVSLAFDDYGTGYASLSLLKRLPVDKLKVDQSFVAGVAESREDAAVVRAILFLGESFGLDTLAEGVETAEQEAALIAMGCRYVQGYRYGEAVPADRFPGREIS